jgi:hypothetical protein
MLCLQVSKKAKMSFIELLLCLTVMSAHVFTATGRAVFAHYMVSDHTTN